MSTHLAIAETHMVASLGPEVVASLQVAVDGGQLANMQQALHSGLIGLEELSTRRCPDRPKLPAGRATLGRDLEAAACACVSPEIWNLKLCCFNATVLYSGTHLDSSTSSRNHLCSSTVWTSQPGFR